MSTKDLTNYIPENHWFVVCGEDYTVLSAHGPYWYDWQGGLDFPSWRFACESARLGRNSVPNLGSHSIQCQDQPQVGISLRAMFTESITEANVITFLTEKDRPRSLYALLRHFACKNDPEPLLDVLEGMLDRRVISETWVEDGGKMRAFEIDPIGQQIQQALTLGYVDVAC